ncbi:MAG: hypothetical protein KY476_01000 [Planctomycetes bacterium]|nr:hypothetical protein [Planctomycetota bacterium]
MSKKRWLLIAASCGVVLSLLAPLALRERFSSDGSLAPQLVTNPSPPKGKQAPPAEELAKPHLDWARKESERIIDDHLLGVDAFFAHSKKNTRAFAKEVLSWSSKWQLIVDQLPFGGGNGHQRFIYRKFEQYFKLSQLDRTVERAIKGYLQSVRSVEGKMLVELRADAADFPTAFVLADIDNRKVQSVYDAVISRAIDASGTDLRADIATGLASVIAGELVAQVAVRLGVSAGILGTGAASGWATLGVGAIVGLIVDQLVSWIWDRCADPTGNLARDVDKKLNELHRLIVDGSDDVHGLRSRLQEFARERASRRHQAVLSLLEPPTGGSD